MSQSNAGHHEDVIQVAGVDLGPGCDNESTGIQIAVRQNGLWCVSRSRAHWVRGGNCARCNERLAEAIGACAVVAVDAPLCLAPSKEWEQLLKGCDALADSMKPSWTGEISGHTWRAAALRPLLNQGIQLIEVFPAAWFGLCEYDASVAWKGDEGAKDRKVAWFRSRIAALAETGLHVDYADPFASGDDADALACVLCAILVAEGRELMHLDDTEPSVLFPARALWDVERLPESVRGLPWTVWQPPAIR